MHTQHAVVSLLALSSGASAFFPTSEIADNIRNTAGSVGSYFKNHGGPASRNVHRRGNQVGDTACGQARRHTDHLAQKQQNPGIFISIAPFARSSSRYAIRNAPPPPTRVLPLGRRDNEYKIVTANKPSQPTSLAVDQDGTDYSYFSTMGIGSKETPMYMLLDTGSAVTWVMADNCKSGPCSIHNTFGSSTGSSTLKTGGSNFKLDYGSGDVSGTMANDSISFAGLKVTVPIGLADHVSNDFQNYPFDGILGLGRVPIQSQPSVTFLQGIAQNKLLPANIFGVNLQRNADGTNDGEINFGAADTSKYQGDLHWIDTIDDHSFWEIVADDIFVDGKSTGLNQKRSAILDTGTSYMLVPPNDAKAIFAKIPGSSTPDGTYWNVPCNAKTPVQIVIGGVGFNISPKDYVGAPAGGKRDDMCISHIVGMAAAGDDHTWLLGDTFLKNVYTVFDADKNRVGFGAKSGSSVIDQGAASKSADGKTAGTSTSSGNGSSSSGGASSSSSGSSAHPSITGALGLPGTGSTKSGDASASGTAVSNGAASTSGTKASAASGHGVQYTLLAVVAASASLLLL